MVIGGTDGEGGVVRAPWEVGNLMGDHPRWLGVWDGDFDYWFFSGSVQQDTDGEAGDLEMAYCAKFEFLLVVFGRQKIDWFCL